MTTKQFLTDNREEVIAYYNTNVKGYYNTNLNNFMLDLINNFRKISIKEELSRTDLCGNLQECKSRLGMMSVEIKVNYTTPYAESNHAKRVNYYGSKIANTLNNL
jgi:hypothetical protein